MMNINTISPNIINIKILRNITKKNGPNYESKH